MAALMAGLALLMTKGKENVRTCSAFGGRVMLPFLDAPVAEPEKPRLALIRESGTWVVFCPMSNGSPRVAYSGRGMEGFQDAVLVFLRSV